MKRSFAFMIAIALSWGLLSLPTSASADSIEIVYQCLPTTITRLDWTMSHFHVKNRLIRKEMDLSGLLKVTGRLSGLDGDPEWYLKLRVGQIICLPAIPAPTYVELRDPTADLSTIFSQLNGTRKRLHAAVNKDHLYDLNPDAVRVYYEITLEKGGVKSLYRKNSIIRDALTEKGFYEVLSKFNNLSIRQLRNLKPGTVVKVPAKPPYVYAPDGKPVNALVAVPSMPRPFVYRLEPQKIVLATKAEVPDPEKPRPPTTLERDSMLAALLKDFNEQLVEIRAMWATRSMELTDLKNAMASHTTTINELLRRTAIFSDPPRGGLDFIPDALWRAATIIDIALKRATGIGLFWWIVVPLFIYLIYRIVRRLSRPRPLVGQVMS